MERGDPVQEIRAVACNYRVPTKICREGAKAFVIWINPGNGSDRVTICARSRGGRWVVKFEDARRLGNFRVVTLVDCRAPYRIVADRAFVPDPVAWCDRMNSRERD